jgi:hypothetical protein
MSAGGYVSNSSWGAIFHQTADQWLGFFALVAGAVVILALLLLTSYMQERGGNAHRPGAARERQNYVHGSSLRIGPFGVWRREK